MVPFTGIDVAVCSLVRQTHMLLHTYRLQLSVMHGLTRP